MKQDNDQNLQGARQNNNKRTPEIRDNMDNREGEEQPAQENDGTPGRKEHQIGDDNSSEE